MLDKLRRSTCVFHNLRTWGKREQLARLLISAREKNSFAKIGKRASSQMGKTFVTSPHSDFSPLKKMLTKNLAENVGTKDGMHRGKLKETR